MKRILFKIFSILVLSLSAKNGYFVSFHDKVDMADFDPYVYFDPKAIENKVLMNLPLYDWYDLPVQPEYVSIVAGLSDSLGYELRWLNGVTVYCSVENLEEIAGLPFVKTISSWDSSIEATSKKETHEQFVKDCEIFKWQLNTMGGDLLQEKGLKAEGIRISIIDVGFNGADKDKQLAHLFENDKIIEAWDFIAKKPINYNGGESHGTYVASFVAGEIDSFQVGHAVDSELLLAKMKSIFSKNKSMEEAWIKAVEWSHQKGARVVNSSVGYTGYNYTHEMLTGKVCKMSLAGNLAARKGMLIVNSAANEGQNNWKMIGFPSDADSVLTVGAINRIEGVRTGYSSYGPTKDLRLKPNVNALGNVFWSDGEWFRKLEGTSFSSPLVAGYVACILQNQPHLKPMDLLDTIQKSCSLYPYFDYSHGYGVPRASLYFGVDTIKSDSASVELVKNANHNVDGYFEIKSTDKERVQVFYQIVDKEGYIKRYWVVEFDEHDDLPRIDFSELNKGDIIRVFHRGTFIEEVYK